MKIGILTYHRAFNCGALLQAWALGQFLSENGYAVEFPDCNTVGLCRFWPTFSRPTFFGKIRNLLGWLLEQIRYCGTWWISVHRFTSFMRKYIPHAECSIDELRRYDLLVVGSDQVWNVGIARKDSPLFLGENVEVSLPMIGYGLSSGDDMLDGDTLTRLRKAAKRFQALGFRERTLMQKIGCGGMEVCDPTFLLSPDTYHKIECKKRLVKGDYLFVYCVSDSDEVLLASRRLARKLGIKLVVADVYRNGLIRVGYPFCNAFAMSPDRLLAYIRDAKYVIVSSFHGCAFSILMQKKFLCLYSEDARPFGRQHELMKCVGLLRYRMPATSSVDEMESRILEGYDVRVNVSGLRNESSKWLLSVIASLK